MFLSCGIFALSARICACCASRLYSSDLENTYNLHIKMIFYLQRFLSTPLVYSLNWKRVQIVDLHQPRLAKCRIPNCTKLPCDPPMGVSQCNADVTTLRSHGLRLLHAWRQPLPRVVRLPSKTLPECGHHGSTVQCRSLASAIQLLPTDGIRSS
jgi:hypothetical protein